MQITFLGHSGFEVKTERYQLIFDYAEGVLPPKDPLRKRIFLVSHHHGDHFSQAIYRDQNEASYVLSSDLSALPDAPLIQVKPRQTIDFEGLTIETLRSTDEGVAFLVTADGWRLYHAGDLNWWHWEPENAADEAENQAMAQRFQAEMEQLRGRHFDAVFLPLDPRLGAAMGWGVRLFLKTARADHVFLMHLWKQYEAIDQALSSELAPWKKEIAPIRYEGQKFEVKRDEFENERHASIG